MNRILKILVAALTLVVIVRANDAPGATRLVAKNYPLAQAVLSNNCIVVAASGQVAVAWAAAQGLLGRRRRLEDVQRAYAASLPAGKQVGFMIAARPGMTNRWHYINKDNESSDIIELARCGPDAEGAELLFRVDGERFFGNFHVVLALRAWPGRPGKTRYCADVWAYPENGMVLFFVRHLGLIERFIRKKTDEIKQIVCDVALRLNREPFISAIAAPATH